MLEFPKLLSISLPLGGASLNGAATETYRTKQQWQPSGSNMCHLEWHSFKGNATIPHPVVVKVAVWSNGRHRRCETTVFMDSFGGCSRAMNVGHRQVSRLIGNGCKIVAHWAQ